MEKDLFALVLVHLRVPSLGPLHGQELVAVLICGGHPEGDVVVSGWVHPSQSHHQSRKQPPV